MKQIALQKKRGIDPLVSLTFKDADTGVSDYMPTCDGEAVKDILNFAIEDYNAGRRWSNGFPTLGGTYLVLMDEHFTVIYVRVSGDLEEINEKKIGKITRYMKL